MYFMFVFRFFVDALKAKIVKKYKKGVFFYNCIIYKKATVVIFKKYITSNPLHSE